MGRRALRWNEQKGASLEWAEGRFAGMVREALRWNGQKGASLECEVAPTEPGFHFGHHSLRKLIVACPRF